MPGPAALRPLLLLATLGVACAGHRASSTGPLGPRHADLPLWRPGPQGERIFVEADLGDGEPRLFLVDTGASLSVLSAAASAELGLVPVERPGQVIGLGGASPWRSAIVENVRLGPFSVPDVAFAVGVDGVPDRLGGVTIHGVIGNDVWQHFTLIVDYPANRMSLWRPDDAPVPSHAVPLHFNGEHIRVEAILDARGRGSEVDIRQPLWLEVDTGAGELLVAGAVHGPLAQVSTEGEEPIFGVGGGDDLPASNFLQRTRRIAVHRVEVGGATIEESLTARWINFDTEMPQVGPPGLPGLLGHKVLDGHRVFIDYQGRRFALSESEGPPQPRDMAEWALTRVKRSKDPEDQRSRALLQAGLGRMDEAQATLNRRLREDPSDAEARVLLARVQRVDGDLAASDATLAALSVADLVAQGEIVAAVNGRWLAGHAAEALSLSQEAAGTQPEASLAWVALSDACRAVGDLQGARRALAEANRLDENPDGHLLRRVWLASAEGDLYGAITHARRLMELYPSSSLAPWFYARQPLDADGRHLLADDLRRARARLHPDDGPLDFFAGAWRFAGEPAEAEAVGRVGRERDCPRSPDTLGRDNCEAWYRALAGVELDQARALIDSTVAAAPDRTDFVDTRAMVLEAQGDLAGARDAAWRAAQLEPDNLYFLWQAARLDAALRGNGT